MIVRNGVTSLVFREHGDEVEVRYSNRGEPYSEGVQISFKDDGSYRKPYVCVLLEEAEVKELRDKLNEYLGQAAAAPPAEKPVVKPEVFGQYDHLDSDAPVFGWLGLGYVCDVAVKANYGAVRLATALVRAIEKRDEGDGRFQSTLGAGLRRLIESGAF